MDFCEAGSASTVLRDLTNSKTKTKSETIVFDFQKQKLSDEIEQVGDASFDIVGGKYIHYDPNMPDVRLADALVIQKVFDDFRRNTLLPKGMMGYTVKFDVDHDGDPFVDIQVLFQPKFYNKANEPSIFSFISSVSAALPRKNMTHFTRVSCKRFFSKNFSSRFATAYDSFSLVLPITRSDQPFHF